MLLGMSPRIAGIVLQISDLQMLDAKITHVRLLAVRPIYMSKYRILQIYFDDFWPAAQTIIVMINSAADRDFDVFRAHSERCSQGFLGLRNGHRCAAKRPGFRGRSRDRHRFEF